MKTKDLALLSEAELKKEIAKIKLKSAFAGFIIAFSIYVLFIHKPKGIRTADGTILL